MKQNYSLDLLVLHSMIEKTRFYLKPFHGSFALNANLDTGSGETAYCLTLMGNDEYPPGILGAIPLLQTMVLAGLLRFPLADFCQGVLFDLTWLYPSMILLTEFREFRLIFASHLARTSLQGFDSHTRTRPARLHKIPPRLMSTLD